MIASPGIALDSTTCALSPNNVMNTRRVIQASIFIGVVATLLFGGSHIAFADEAPKTLLELDPLKGATAIDVIRNVISLFLGMVGALALGVFVYAGVTWMTAGSSDRIQKAKDAMKYAVIGLALIAFAFAITTFFIDTLTGKVQQQSQLNQAAQQAPATPPPVNP